jgi:hypothetical protein
LFRPDQIERTRKAPDFVFVHSQQRWYVIEVTRLIDQALLRVEAFGRAIHKRLNAKLHGIYTLKVPFWSLGSAGIPASDADRIVAHLTTIVRRGILPQLTEPLPGYVVERVREDGDALVPLLIVPDIPPVPNPENPRVRQLMAVFNSAVAEAIEKFEWVLPDPVVPTERSDLLLIDIGQSGLDWEVHAMLLGGRPSLMAGWVAGLRSERALPAIYLEPGVGVWSPETRMDGPADSPIISRILTGTRYVGAVRGFNVRLHPGPVGLV